MHKKLENFKLDQRREAVDFMVGIPVAGIKECHIDNLKEFSDDALDYQLSIIREIIEGKKKNTKWGEDYPGSYEESCEDDGYDQVLDDLLKELE